MRSARPQPTRANMEVTSGARRATWAILETATTTV
jgi:hypothetical protein